MEMEPRKLFVGGISWDTNEDRLREYFRTFGEVLEAVIIKDRTTGRARGFGFVVFADSTVAERVVREKHMIDGRTVETKKAVPRDDQHILNRNNGSIQGSLGPASTKKIFVGGLASTVTENDFKKYFDQFGTTTDVVVMYDHNTQRPRGFGFITYDSEEAVDKVLLKTFHELNGKMVEVKRAVPKELSPGPTRSQPGGYNYGLRRVSSFLNAFTQGYYPSTVGGHGVRMDGRFSPITGGRNGYPPFSPSSFGAGPKFEPGLSPNYGGTGSFGSGLGYGRGLNTLYNAGSNRYSSSIDYGMASGGSGYVPSSTNWNMWDNGSPNYSANSASARDFMSSRGGSIGLNSAFGSIESIWGFSPISGQGGGISSAFNGGNSYHGSRENSSESSGIRYGRISGSSLGPTSSYATNDGQDGPFGNFTEGSSFYGDPTWQSPSVELEDAGFLGYGLGNATSDVMPENSLGYFSDYGVTNRSNRGIAA